MSKKRIQVKLVHSTIGRNRVQEKIVRGLGLRKLGSVRELTDTVQVRGMVAKIPHLVKIMQENIAVKEVRKKVAPKKTTKKAVKETEVEVKNEAK